MDITVGVGGAQKNIKKKKSKKHQRPSEGCKAQEDLTAALQKVALQETTNELTDKEQENQASPLNPIQIKQSPTNKPGSGSGKKFEVRGAAKKVKTYYITSESEIIEERRVEEEHQEVNSNIRGAAFGPKKETRDVAVQCNLGEIFTIPASRGRMVYCNLLRFDQGSTVVVREPEPEPEVVQEPEPQPTRAAGGASLPGPSASLPRRSAKRNGTRQTLNESNSSTIVHPPQFLD